MKYIIYGNSIILLGIVSLLTSWMGEIQFFDIIGIALAIIGFFLSTYGFLKKA